MGLAPVAAIYGIFHSSGQVYVGSTCDIERRWAEHRRYLIRGAHHCKHLQRAWDKYGADTFTFTILELISPPIDWDILIAREEAWFAAFPQRYNSLPHAGTARGFKHSPETIERMRLIQAGRIVTPEQRAKISATLKGRPLTAETRAKMGAARKGKPRSPEVGAKISQTNMGHAVSEDARAKMRAANLGHKQSPEQIAKRMATMKARGHTRKGKPVSEETRAKMSESGKGRKHTPEARAKIAAAVKQRMSTPEGRAAALRGVTNRWKQQKAGNQDG